MALSRAVSSEAQLALEEQFGVVVCALKVKLGSREGALREAVEALRECLSRDGAWGTWREAARDAVEGGQHRLGGVDCRQLWRGRGTQRRRWRLPGRSGAGPGQEEVSAPGHQPRGGFPESSWRERALALRPGAGRTGRKEEGARAEPQECTVEL